jgi:hypothetical protein
MADASEEGAGTPDSGFQRRMPSVFKKVSDIRPEDMRISVIGTVIDKADDGIVVDDGTGKIDVTLDSPTQVEVKALVRVFGRVFPSEGGFHIQGEIVQDMKGLDMQLLKKVESIKI